MKILAHIIIIIAIFTGCRKENTKIVTNSKQTVSFNVSVDNSVKTRAGIDAPTRYVMEIYQGEKAIGAPAVHKEQASGTFENVILEDKQQYTILFWADYGTPAADRIHPEENEYNASDLKAIVVTKQPTAVAYAGVSRFTVGVSDESLYTKVTLNHAVAQVNFNQTKALTSVPNILTVKYPKSYSLNIDGNIATEIEGEVTHTFVYNSKAIGTLGTSYIIAATGTPKTIMDIKAILNSETAKIASNVPFESNYRTNISGAYSDKYEITLSVSCDEAWGTPDNESAITPPHIYNNDTKEVIPRGMGTQANPYLLESASNIKWLQTYSAIYGNTDGKYFKLMSDIEVISDIWIPIGINATTTQYNNIKFNGYFDGNGHQFRGKLTAPTDYASSTFGILGYSGPSSEISNLTNAAEVIAPNTSAVGGIIGMATGKITNCKNTAKITAKHSVGGVIGYGYYLDTAMTSGEKVVISGCENSGEVISIKHDEGLNYLYSNLGGILGKGYFQPSDSVTENSQVVFIIENCNNTGNISGLANCLFIGGIIGWPAITYGTCKIKNCSNTGIVKSGDVTATENIGGDNSIGLLAGGQYTGYNGITLIE